MKNGSNFEYQYALADHQGNTRVVFSSVTPDPDASLATFEDPEADAEHFLNVPDASPFWASFTAANHTPGGIKVVRMNQNFAIGAAKSLKVYPGDKVDMEVWTYYENNSGFGTGSPPLTTLITAIAGAFGGSSGAGGESGAIYDGVDQALVAFGTGGSQGDTRPGAYLNYILFDNKFKLLDAGWVLVPTSALTSQQKISIPTVDVTQAGFIFVYLSYENESNNYVQFDDFKVTYTKSNILQYNEYYPFGLQTSNSWTREDASNNFLYNGGSELNDNSGWYETFFRGYDASLGRFMQALPAEARFGRRRVDPLAGKYASLSPYNYAFNSPVLFNDPMGDDADDPTDPMYGKRSRSGPGSGNHWTDDPYYHQTSSNPERFVESAMNSQYGGAWSSSGGGHLFGSDREALSYHESKFRSNSYEMSLVYGGKDFKDGKASVRLLKQYLKTISGLTFKEWLVQRWSRPGGHLQGLPTSDELHRMYDEPFSRYLDDLQDKINRNGWTGKSGQRAVFHEVFRSRYYYVLRPNLQPDQTFPWEIDLSLTTVGIGNRGLLSPTERLGLIPGNENLHGSTGFIESYDHQLSYLAIIDDAAGAGMTYVISWVFSPLTPQ